VKQSDLGEYEENAIQNQNIQYTRQSTNCPSNQAIWMANTNFLPQISKLRRLKGFGENVSQLKVTSTLETNTMRKQTWVVTKAL
jgi:hypothetical protein